MMRRLKAAFTENLLLKIISIVFAVILWLLVVNINNPRQSRNFTTNVTVINANVLAEQGKYYTIPEGANTVTFRVTAPRSVIERLSTEDFKAVADMSHLEDDQRVPIDISAVNYAASISLSTRKYYLNVEIGEQIEEKYVISVAIEGTPASGFVVDSATVTPNVITIRGPEPIVSTIKSVRAICDVSGMNAKITENVVPSILDAQGNRVDTSKLNVSVNTLNVDVSFTNVKEVPIVLEQPDAVNPNVEVSSITINPSKVQIKGDSSILNDITEIVIPSTVIDVSSITADTATTVDITRYLPMGVELTSETEPEVSVDIKVTTEATRYFEVPVGNISVRNLERGLKLDFVSSTVRVQVNGLPSELSSLSPANMTGSIDATGLGVGEQTIRLDMDEGENVQFEPATITVNITETGQ